MISSKRLLRTAFAFAALTVICLAVTLLRRHHLEDSSGLIEGAYFSRTAYAGLSSGNDLLAPFRPLNAYLWLGATLAFACSSLTLFVLAWVARRGTAATTA